MAHPEPAGAGLPVALPKCVAQALVDGTIIVAIKDFPVASMDPASSVTFENKGQTTMVLANPFPGVPDTAVCPTLPFAFGVELEAVASRNPDLVEDNAIPQAAAKESAEPLAAVINESVSAGKNIAVLNVGSKGTPAKDVAPHLPGAVATNMLRHFAGSSAFTLTASVAVLTETYCEDIVAGGRLEMSRDSMPGGWLGPVDASAVKVEDAMVLDEHAEAAAKALSAMPTGLAVVSLHAKITQDNGTVVNSRVMLIWAGKECTAVHDALLQLRSGKVATHGSLLKRYVLTAVSSGWPICIAVVYFGFDAGVARTQLAVAEAARDFRRFEAERAALWMNLQEKNAELARENTELGGKAATKQRVLASEQVATETGYSCPTASSRARSAERGRQLVATSGGAGRSRSRGGSATAFGGTGPRALAMSAPHA